MLTRHPSHLLASYCDGSLAPDEARRVEAHLATCARCRHERDDIRFAASVLKQMPLATPPPSVWHAIDQHLGATPEPAAWRWRWQLACALLAIAIGAGLFLSRTGRGGVPQPWEVTLAEAGRSEVSRQAEGDWVETTAASRARIVVGPIGTVDVEPQTRVRLGTLQPDAYRLELSQGTISARILAPPRLFIVETPASTLVDLGCAYRVTVDLDGNGTLQVTDGWTALEWRGRESLVPAGASARIRRGAGPGMPTFDDASSTLTTAVHAFDAGTGGDAAVSTLLSAARVRDTLTLWHLLTRTDGDQRVRVYERLHALVPAPPNAPRELVMQLDVEALRHWREELAWHW